MDNDFSPVLDETLIEKVFQTSLDALQVTREQVFDIAEAGRDELDRLKMLVEEVQNETTACIRQVDELTVASRRARRHLNVCNRHPERFSDAEIRQAYIDAERWMVELGVAREREQALKQRRNDLERQLRHLRQVLGKAEQVVSQVGAALDFLSGNVDNLHEHVEGMRDKAAMARQVIRVQEEERRRVARDIHDGPAQLLANMAMRVELLERMIDAERDALIAELHDMQDVVKDSLRDLRRIIFNLRPMALDDLGLVPTIRGYIDDLRQQAEFDTEFRVAGRERRLSSTTEIALFRVIQEALTNADKHSRCRLVVVQLEYGEQNLYMKVTDDGVGFEPEEMPADEGEPTFGLLHMRERIHLLQGKFRIESQPGRGTEVMARVPIATEEDDTSENTVA